MTEHAAPLQDDDPILTPEGIMVDIETLSTHPDNAVVLSIGAARFALSEESAHIIGTPFLVALDLNAQIAAGRDISAGTMEFWRNQTPEARAHWANAKTVPINDGLYRFADFLRYENGPLHVHVPLPLWANGICFDIGNLESLYRRFYATGVPWKYNTPRDARTIYAALPELRQRPETLLTGPNHSPVADCINQVWRLWEHWPHFDQ